jgi:predicted Zn-ribbon and HTH transcriptional regulator
MAMKKAEMEEHTHKYDALMKEALRAQKKGRLREALKTAVASLPHVYGMMRYERKYSDKDFESVRAIDLILKYAPLLFDLSALDEIQALLDDTRLVEKHTSHNLADKLDAAREFIWQAHGLWDYLEKNPNCRMDELSKVGARNENTCESLIRTWGEMNLVHVELEGRTCRLRLSTMMNEMVRAKCPECGHIQRAAKSIWLTPKRCPACTSSVLFVMLQESSTSNVRG